MPITHSAKKALRRDVHRTQSNHLVREKLKIALDAARKEPNLKSVSAGFSAIDRATKKKLIHKNKAARLKSQLSKKLATGPKSRPVKKKVVKAKSAKK